MLNKLIKIFSFSCGVFLLKSMIKGKRKFDGDTKLNLLKGYELKKGLIIFGIGNTEERKIYILRNVIKPMGP